MQPGPRRTARKVVKLIGVNLLVSVVFLELASVGAYFLKTGDLVYVRNRGRVAAALAQLDARPLEARTDSLALIFRLHPYFGFVYRTGYVQDGVTTNNFGFLTPHHVPFRKTSKDQFVIGVFGGSVAALWSFHEPKVRVLAVGQELDLVVNIDGFNEAAFSYLDNQSGVDVSMPSASLISPLIDLADKDLSPRELTVTLGLLHRKSQLRAALAALDDCTLAVCYSLRWLHVQYLLRQYARRDGGPERGENSGAAEGLRVLAEENRSTAR